MKKTLFAALAVLCVAVLVPQTLEAGVGLKGGYSWSTISIGSPVPLPFTFGTLSSITGGAYFGVGLGLFSVQPEILYTRMGGKYEVGEDSMALQYQYIQVPVLLKINVIPASPLRPFICGGGYGAYLLKAEGVMVVAGTREETSLTEDYQRLDYGVVGGAGLAFKLPGVSVSIEGRYNLGLMNIVKSPAEGESIKNRSIMALVGIGF